MSGMKPVSIILTVLVFGVSACGTQATPAIDPEQVQASAAAMAGTMFAATNVTLRARHPMTPTPSKTAFVAFDATISPIPTAAVINLPTTVTPSSTNDTCSGNISIKEWALATSVPCLVICV